MKTFRLSQSCAPSPSVRSDDKAASLLYFDGRPQAHGLFDFLLHEAILSSEAVDIPTLLAPVPFIGATLHQHIPQVSPDPLSLQLLAPQLCVQHASDQLHCRASGLLASQSDWIRSAPTLLWLRVMCIST